MTKAPATEEAVPTVSRVNECFCRMCGSGRLKDSKIVGPVRLRSCCDCGFAGADLTEWESPYASADYYAGVDGGKAIASGWRLPYIEHRVKRIQRWIERGRAVDLGAGWGGMVECLMRAGFEAHGVEESQVVLETVSPLLPAGTWHCKGIEPFLAQSSAEFQVVTLYHVMEHVRDPRRIANGIERITTPGSVVVVEIPFLFGGKARLRGRRWEHLVPHHINFFSLASLARLFPAERWALLDIERKPHFAHPQGIRLRDGWHKAMATLGLYDNICLTWRRLP
jgi:hypothetical protein